MASNTIELMVFEKKGGKPLTLFDCFQSYVERGRPYRWDFAVRIEVQPPGDHRHTVKMLVRGMRAGESWGSARNGREIFTVVLDQLRVGREIYREVQGTFDWDPKHQNGSVVKGKIGTMTVKLSED